VGYSSGASDFFVSLKIKVTEGSGLSSLTEQGLPPKASRYCVYPMPALVPALFFAVADRWAVIILGGGRIHVMLMTLFVKVQHEFKTWCTDLCKIDTYDVFPCKTYVAGSNGVSWST
jgi:hypothetical protein